MKIDTVRAWKDETYHESLSDEQRAALPANPAGELDLTEVQLKSIYGSGGAGPANSPAAAAAPVPVPVPVGGGGFASSHLVTFAVECENTAFSLNFNTGAALFSFPTNVCINNE